LKFNIKITMACDYKIRIVYIPRELVEATHKIMGERYAIEKQKQQEKPQKEKGLIRRLLKI